MWCMDLIYRGIGVPDIPRQLMMDLLGPGQIDHSGGFQLDYENLESDKVILSILHIACFMDCLQEKLSQCPDPVQVRHHQRGSGIDISSTLFVDDQLDVTTSERGIQAHTDITNVFTGKLGSGGVFGATKSFMMYMSDSASHYNAVQLNDGQSVPHPVQVVAPVEGFKHLGIYQGGCNQ
ncbi:hypothetical protein PHMEG_00030455 [Phytophthora megakarya]|uniref:Uncharacterized protein n=1 Tax=Phytophthora megakarya TaxID=4795 RepID=A0A225V0B5_9STRA|nr:hypothetical protein PHMEG_00030455 [Phytophthora megakarya]